jgi:hypothetical protein
LPEQPIIELRIAECGLRNEEQRFRDQLWIPAEELAAMNENIVGEIEVIAEFRG